MTPTHSQKRLLDFIALYIDRRGVGPSFSEMQDHMRLASKSGVSRLLSGLEQRRLIRRMPNRPRAIELTAPVVRRPGAALPQLSDLASVSDDDLWAECERRGLLRDAA